MLYYTVEVVTEWSLQAVFGVSSNELMITSKRITKYLVNPWNINVWLWFGLDRIHGLPSWSQFDICKPIERTQAWNNIVKTRKRDKIHSDLIQINIQGPFESGRARTNQSTDHQLIVILALQSSNLVMLRRRWATMLFIASNGFSSLLKPPWPDVTDEWLFMCRLRLDSVILDLSLLRAAALFIVMTKSTRAFKVTGTLNYTDIRPLNLSTTHELGCLPPTQR